MANRIANGAAAHEVVSDIEVPLATLVDLGWAVVMSAQSETGMEEHYASALCRLGMLIVEQANSAEAHRGQAMDHLYAYRYPDKAVRS